MEVGVQRIDRIDRFDLGLVRKLQSPGRKRMEMGDDKRARSVSGREKRKGKKKAAGVGCALSRNGPVVGLALRCFCCLRARAAGLGVSLF